MIETILGIPEDDVILFLMFAGIIAFVFGVAAWYEETYMRDK